MSKKRKEQTCKRCAWVWTPLVDSPRTCPRCKSYKWKEPKSTDRVEK